MRNWQRALNISENQKRAIYYDLLIPINKLREPVARYHATTATIEEIDIHIKANTVLVETVQLETI